MLALQLRQFLKFLLEHAIACFSSPPLFCLVPLGLCLMQSRLPGPAFCGIINAGKEKDEGYNERNDKRSWINGKRADDNHNRASLFDSCHCPGVLDFLGERRWGCSELARINCRRLAG